MSATACTTRRSTVSAAGCAFVGRSVDGITEAYESERSPWLVGVQWHPEDNAGELDWQQALYDDLLRHA